MPEAPPRWRTRIVGQGDEDPKALVANPRNFRLHPRRQAEATTGSLDELGWIQRVTVNRSTGYVVNGHLRVELAAGRGDPTVPVSYVELSEAEEALAIATLDPIAAMAVADREKLGVVLADISTDNPAIVAMLEDLATTVGAGLGQQPVTEDDVPDGDDLLEQWGVEPGQLWAAGSHRVMCGDVLARDDVAALMAGAKAAMVWTSPPAGVPLVGALRNVSAFLEPRSPFYVLAPPAAVLETWEAVEAAGWRLHESLAWVQDGPATDEPGYNQAHGDLLYGYLPGTGRAGRGRGDASRWHGDNTQTSVFEIPRRPRSTPVELAAIGIRNSSPAGGSVLDPFAGSGTTVIACQQLRRSARAIDANPWMVALTLQRYEGFTGEAPRRLS